MASSCMPSLMYAFLSRRSMRNRRCSTCTAARRETAKARRRGGGRRLSDPPVCATESPFRVGHIIGRLDYRGADGRCSDRILEDECSNSLPWNRSRRRRGSTSCVLSGPLAPRRSRVDNSKGRGDRMRFLALSVKFL
jgi:hypothetical protein